MLLLLLFMRPSVHALHNVRHPNADNAAAEYSRNQ